MASCVSCGANWSEGKFSPGCPECGGGALDAPCLICGGRCGSRWQRAVQDSNDSRLAHFHGQCGLPQAEQRAILQRVPRSRRLEFTRDALRGIDVDWFAVDRVGAIAIFTTGYGVIPRSVFESEERHSRLSEFFDGAPEISEACLVSGLDPRGNYDLFVAEARRGLYSYYHSDYRTKEPYKLIAYPVTPALLGDLPEEIQAMLAVFRLDRIEFGKAEIIRIDEHFECE